MNKAKLIDLAVKGGALILAGVVTVMNNKVAHKEMEETVAKKVAEELANRAKES